MNLFFQLSLQKFLSLFRLIEIRINTNNVRLMMLNKSRYSEDIVSVEMELCIVKSRGEGVYL